MSDSTSGWEANSDSDPDPKAVTLSPRELVARRHELNGLDVYVEGRMAIEDEDLSGLRCHLLVFRAGSFLAESLRSWRPSPRFTACNFAGLTVDRLVFAGASFHRCDFSGMEAKLHLGTDAVELVGCSFSGDLDGNLSRGHSRFRRYPIHGNDFSRLRGVDFHDGVGWRQNTFDLGRTQLILDVEDARDPRVREVFKDTAYGQVLADSLIHRRPINTGQRWSLLHQDLFEPRAWTSLVSLLGHHRTG